MRSGRRDRHAGRLVGEASARLENYAGKTTLTGLVSIISRARLLIGNESGPIHLAAALGTPCVSVVGGGHFGRFCLTKRTMGR